MKQQGDTGRSAADGGQQQQRSDPHGSQSQGSPARGGKQDAEQPFFTDVKTLRERARQHMQEGAVTQTYGADPQTVVKVLNAALATEIVCVLRYRRHYYMAEGLASESVKAEFLEHANEEQEHADRISERIVQLGGEPDLNPETLTARSHSQYVEGKDLVDMIREDLVAERIAIDSYREIVQWLGTKDSTTRRLLEEVLENEEEHAEDLNSMLQGMGAKGMGGASSQGKGQGQQGAQARGDD